MSTTFELQIYNRFLRDLYAGRYPAGSVPSDSPGLTSGFYETGPGVPVGTIGVDWNNGSKQHILMARNTTVTLANPADGARYLLLFTANDPASYTVTFSGVNIRWPGGTPYVYTAAGEDLVVLIYSGAYGYMAQTALNFLIPS